MEIFGGGSQDVTAISIATLENPIFFLYRVPATDIQRVEGPLRDPVSSALGTGLRPRPRADRRFPATRGPAMGRFSEVERPAPSATQGHAIPFWLCSGRGLASGMCVAYNGRLTPQFAIARHLSTYR